MKGIYAITPNDIEENQLIEKSQELIEAKIDFLQIRRKGETLDQIYSVASKILKFTKNHSCKLIINDHLEIAKDLNADGVHLGMEDYENFLKKTDDEKKVFSSYFREKVIGLSCKNNLGLVKNPPIDLFNWDYLAVGSMFKTSTKTDAVIVNPNQRSLLMRNSSKPLIAIGGIDEKNIGILLKDNYNFFAISRFLFNNNSPSGALNKIKKIIKQS
ncbi:MAG: thiamine phosphate synthase [Gammaproteobacteria bacterium]